MPKILNGINNLGYLVQQSDMTDKNMKVCNNNLIINLLLGQNRKTNKNNKRKTST